MPGRLVFLLLLLFLAEACGTIGKKLGNGGRFLCWFVTCEQDGASEFWDTGNVVFMETLPVEVTTGSGGVGMLLCPLPMLLFFTFATALYPGILAGKPVEY